SKDIDIDFYLKRIKSLSKDPSEISKFLPLSEIGSQTSLGRIVYTNAFVSKITPREVFRYDVDGKTFKRRVSAITISDGGQEISWGVVASDELDEELRLSLGKRIRIFGAIIEVPKSKNRSIYNFI